MGPKYAIHIGKYLKLFSISEKEVQELLNQCLKILTSSSCKTLLSPEINDIPKYFEKSIYVPWSTFTLKLILVPPQRK